MTEFQVFGSGRTNGCKGGKITHLGIMEYKEMWRISKIIDIIEKQGDTFWTYVYKNGLIEKHIKIDIKVAFDKEMGKFLRTQIDSNVVKNIEGFSPYFNNNLLELPIYYYNEENGKWHRCKI